MGRKKEKMVSTILWGKRGSPDYYIVEQLMNIRKLNFSDLCREALREWWVRRNNKDFECYVWREEIYKNQETMRSLQRRNDELRLLIKDKHYLTNIELDEFLNNSSIERIIKKKNKDIPDSLKNKPLSNSEVDNVLGVAKGVKNE